VNPWNFIGWYIIGREIGRFLRRNARLLISAFLIYLAYQYAMMAVHYLRSIL
jgi:hypothetical protein